MIDQQVRHLSPPPPAERSRRWLRRFGVTALVAAGVAGGLFITVPVVWTVLWVGGSYLFLGDEGLEHALETLTPQEELPAPGPPPRPPVATRDAEGAAAATRHFVAVYEHAYVSSDPSRLEALSTPQCVTCTFAAEALHRAQERDVRFFLVDLEPTAASVTSFTPDRAVVHLSVTTADAFVRFSSTDIRGLGGGSTENDVVLVWAEDRWKVDSVDGGLWAPGLDP